MNGRKPHSDPVRVPMHTATVRRQFDRRAQSFAQHDFLVREIDRRLLEKLDPIRLQPARILDLGCGAGASRAGLQNRFPQATWIGVDQSLPMLRQGLPRGGVLARWLRRPQVDRIAAEAGALPIADGAIDLAYSNLMPHWHPRPDLLFAEWRRVLSVGGLVLFSAFGPDTLKELRAACAPVLPQAAPMPFIDMHDFGDMLVGAGFGTPVVDAEFLRLTYPSAAHLLREVIALGGNPRDDRGSALVSGRQARAVMEALAAQRDADGRISLSFEIVYAHAWRLPTRKPGETTIEFRNLRKTPSF
jgi:malonyl-CoA O-methyltransferase